MSGKPKLKSAAIQIGHLLSNDTSMSKINRVASGAFSFDRKSFPRVFPKPNPFLISEFIAFKNAQLIYEWLMTLFEQQIPEAEMLELLKLFLNTLVPKKLRSQVQQVLDNCEIPVKLSAETPNEEVYNARRFHPEVVLHSKELFLKGEYFHAVFEAVKGFNQAVKQKAGLDKDGVGLMHDAFSSSRPKLKITPCKTPTEQDIQDGYRFLAAGLMSAIRNPLAHEPVTSIPLDREDALDILSLVSYLFRWLDKAVVEESP